MKMDALCNEIGINIQHLCETAVTGRYQLICDKQWLQTLEQRRKIAPFNIWPKLDRRAHPNDPLDHPWTRILLQSYPKKPNVKVFPLQWQANDRVVDVVVNSESENPLTYSQALAYVTSTNFKNLWEAAYKRYPGANVKSAKSTNTGRVVSPSTAFSLTPYDVVLRELIQRVYNCPVIHCQLDRLVDEKTGKNGSYMFSEDLSGPECHANIMPAIVAVETSTHFCVLFYPPAIVTSLYDCITYSPSILGKSYNKALFIIYQILQLSKALQASGLFLGDIGLHDIMVRENLWIQVVPRLESCILRPNIVQHVATSPSETAHGVEGEPSVALEENENESFVCGGNDDDGDDDTVDNSSNTKFDLQFAYDLDQFTLREYCEMWCNGQLSNYDYLTILNNAAGRSLNNPAYHHIMPWVTDFTARNGLNWRDLTKSKYRLNKGDVHLDLMFSHATQPGGNCIGSTASVGLSAQAPHHVSDFLSEITYFVYMARRTPQELLCQHVRPIWVPAEYPVSIQRLQQWTPDECIPEFYSDPMIFKSIHEDLPDLELPAWASCPEDFIAKHREALESQYVSERLQYWIDLNFGYKLSGKAAVKSKNVCLSLVDQHKELCQRGIVQLFTTPHPAKRFPSPWFNKTPPRLNQLHAAPRSPLSANSTLRANDSRRLAKSTENLNTSEATNVSPTELTAATTSMRRNGGSSSSPRRSLRANNATGEMTSSSNFYPSTNFIDLPKDYNACALLQSLEAMETFFARTFPKQKPATNTLEKIINSDLLFDAHSSENSFTNRLFLDDSPNVAAQLHNKQKPKSLLAPSPDYLKKRSIKQIYTEHREHELQVLGCLIVELFAMQRLRAMLMNGANACMEERLQACRTVFSIYRQDIPKCLRYIVGLLLQPHSTDVVTEKGLPPPTASQLLEPIFANQLIPFPSTFYPTYALIRSLHQFEFNASLLELCTHFNCNGRECAKYTDMDRHRVLFERKIAECKVMSCCAFIGRLLEPIAYEQFSPVELLLPHIIDLLLDEQTSILTAWNLFDSFAQALGLVNTQKYLLLPIMKLYDVESFDRGMISVRTRSADANSAAGGQVRFSTSSSFKSRKSVKLYHHSFLLHLIVRFGLKCFLHNFIAPLIEAVGGYKEPEDGNGFHYHSSTNGGGSGSRRTSRNINYASTTEDDISMTLMSTEGPEQDDATLHLKIPATSSTKQEVEDVFSFDDDANSDHISNSGTSENKSLDSFDMRPAPAEEAKEDFNQGDTASGKLAISEIFYGSKISNTSLEDADKVSLNSQGLNDSPTAQIGPKSPTIEIPASAIRRSYQLNTIDCDIGSRKSIDSFEIITQAVEEEQKQLKKQQIATDKMKPGAENQNAAKEEEAEEDSEAQSQVALDSLQASVISKMSEAKAAQNNRISEMSAGSLMWLAHRLGPSLTSRYITRNLLKMLSLCYVGQENLLPETNELTELGNLNYFSIADAHVVGDRSAARVLECLMSIAALFGEEVILVQYFPHISELIALGSKRITASLEGAIISTLQLLKYLVPCLLDATLMENLKETILKNILLPIVRILGSTRLLMPSGYLGRSVLARKWLDAVYTLCVRIGPDMSKEHLCIPTLRPFFLIFDKAFSIREQFENPANSQLSISPPISYAEIDDPAINCRREREEIRDVFSPALAHISYLSFLRFLGEAIMQRTICNLEFILTLCHEFEQPDYKSLHIVASKSSTDAVDSPSKSRENLAEPELSVANSFGTNVVGNRIEVVSAGAGNQSQQEVGPMEVLDMVAYKFDQIPTVRHLKGNWLAYWRHEITRSDKDTMLNLKQIKLQSFVGHTNSVRSILALDNENSFISASKDKTVKLWSLRSEGDGRKTTSCQFTYTKHKKSIHSLAFLEATRYVVSCDSGVHVWDPFIGRPVIELDAPKHNPITVVKALPSPSPLILAGTAESSVKIIDTRCMQYVNEWRVSNAATQSNATVRCLTVAPSGNWLAVGLSSGSIVMLDTRTGCILNAWRPMECDLLQLAAPNDQQLISSALDHSLAVWHAADGILHYQLKPPAEPAHFLQTIDTELIYATTGNRIGIYADISSSHATHTVTKLRPETFRGVLTSLAVLPLNRTFLAGNESGNISLLC